MDLKKAFQNSLLFGRFLSPSGRSRLTAHRSQSGRSPAFTLLEVILAMGIVTMLVLMIANMFQEVSQTWNIGTQSAEMNVAGRTAVEFMAQELAQAVAGPIELPDPRPAGVLSAILFELSGSKVSFVSLAGTADTNQRALRGVCFEYVAGNMTLNYHREPDSFRPYNDSPPNTAGGVLVENVTGFELSAYPTHGDLLLNSALPGYKSSDYADKLPAAVDIYVEVLGADDKMKYAKLVAEAGDSTQFKKRNARRYTTRVYFNNRLGFQARP